MSEPAFQAVSVQEGYALWAASYDQEKNGLIFVEERQVDRLLAELAFSRVLDVGTGTGRHALQLARRAVNVTALDQSAEMLTVARQAAQREDLTIDFHLLSLDDGLPFEAHQFDLLICALMLSHVPNLAQVLQEFARVLQDGGYLLITDFHPVHTIYGWKTAFRRAGVTYHLPTVRHSRDDYLEAITASGLRILEVAESLVGEAPESYLPQEMRRLYADKPLCLSILAQKERAQANAPQHRMHLKLDELRPAYVRKNAHSPVEVLCVAMATDNKPAHDAGWHERDVTDQLCYSPASDHPIFDM